MCNWEHSVVRVPSYSKHRTGDRIFGSSQNTMGGIFKSGQDFHADEFYYGRE
jgi:hypothetical protein